MVSFKLSKILKKADMTRFYLNVMRYIFGQYLPVT